MTDKRREKLDVPSQDKLDELARITPSDVDRAVSRWKRHAPPQFRDLLDAQVDDDSNKPEPG
ncbi:MAG: hypothetical protein H0T48_07360 [Gemmatimonadaceae bacterium]|nr:hypothetical protein [Gemmatimonadaceae bacterium]